MDVDTDNTVSKNDINVQVRQRAQAALKRAEQVGSKQKSNKMSEFSLGIVKGMPKPTQKTGSTVASLHKKEPQVEIEFGMDVDNDRKRENKSLGPKDTTQAKEDEIQAVSAKLRATSMRNRWAQREKLAAVAEDVLSSENEDANDSDSDFSLDEALNALDGVPVEQLGDDHVLMNGQKGIWDPEIDHDL